MTADQRIARVASAQEGHVTTAQMRRAGLSYKEIETRAAHGFLIRRHQGVYAVGHVPPGWFPRAYAAWLAHGDRSALSHVTCAGALGVLPEPDGPLHLTRPTTGLAQRGTILHEAELTGDVWHRRGLVLTSPARLMLDLSATEPAPVVERAYNQAQVLRLLTPPQLATKLDGWQGRRGVLLLKALLEDRGASRSVLEQEFRGLVRAARLGQPVLNIWVDGVFADAVWHDERVIVELDGRAFHSHDTAFEGDRRKGNRLALRGWTLLRFTHRRIRQEPYAVVAELTAALTRSAAA